MPEPIIVVRIARVGDDAVGQVVAAAEAGEPGIGRWLHAPLVERPYRTRLPSPGTREIVCLDPRLARALLAGGDRLGLAPEIVRQVTIVELADGPAPERAVVTHRSPCHYRTAGGPGKPRLAVVLPDLARLFGGLARAWDQAGGAPQAWPNVAAIGARLENYAVRAWPIAGGQRLDGFTGRVTLDLRRLTAEQHRAAWALLRLGALVGVGSHTTYGMGWIEVGAVPCLGGDGRSRTSCW